MLLGSAPVKDYTWFPILPCEHGRLRLRASPQCRQGEKAGWMRDPVTLRV